ncbi:hypothetical protein CLOM_g10485 [Closterium sp. NIES-68]|nr:hypothetical protein CLOM_g10485 [Closterium sp. NIES-68]
MFNNYFNANRMQRRTRDNRPFEVITDASDIAMGAVLMQDFGNGLQPIAYESRKMQSAERNYPIHDKEMLAIVHAFKIWRCYLTGADVTVRTDHKYLQYLRAQPNLNPRQIRWLDYLESNFTYKIPDKKGANNIADALSRPSAQLAAILVRGLIMVASTHATTSISSPLVANYSNIFQASCDFRITIPQRAASVPCRRSRPQPVHPLIVRSLPARKTRIRSPDPPPWIGWRCEARSADRGEKVPADANRGRSGRGGERLAEGRLGGGRLGGGKGGEPATTEVDWSMGRKLPRKGSDDWTDLTDSLLLATWLATVAPPADDRPLMLSDSSLLSPHATVNYFAYGSNLNLELLQRRSAGVDKVVADVSVVAEPAVVYHHRLAFNVRVMPPFEPAVAAIEPVVAGIRPAVAGNGPAVAGIRTGVAGSGGAVLRTEAAVAGSETAVAGAAADRNGAAVAGMGSSREGMGSPSVHGLVVQMRRIDYERLMW